MIERPILFSGPMIRAILEDRKTQTRRIMRGKPPFCPDHGEACPDLSFEMMAWGGWTDGWTDYRKCLYGQPGDRLWVREKWAHVNAIGCNAKEHDDPQTTIYAATCTGAGPYSWRPSIHMPRWASRLLLEILAVRVQRLQDISEEDAKAEGIETNSNNGLKRIRDFALLWDSINSKRGFGWYVNPWVFVIEFKRLKP